MKIAYLANHGNKNSDDTEGHIAHSLETLGHEVIRQPEAETPVEADVLLFHKASNLEAVKQFKGKSVCWYFDKINFNGRDRYMAGVLETTDKVAVTDGTWANEVKSKKVRVIRQGIGDRDTSLGEYREEYDYDVVFTGSVYGARQDFIRKTGAKVINNAHNRDFYNLCASAKIFIAPEYPSDGRYWSNRVYLTLGAGGFLLHPDLHDLDKEFTRDELIRYPNEEELLKLIEYYLERPEEREETAMRGREGVLQNYTFTDRVKELIEWIET